MTDHLRNDIEPTVPGKFFAREEHFVTASPSNRISLDIATAPTATKRASTPNVPEIVIDTAAP